ncbi:MAG TPA: spermidine/putrescine ABC transporter substrate-binding protein [Tepidisphaeraceae bacterium]|jgi:spermidine/putrescine transport system substrate-binding protein
MSIFKKLVAAAVGAVAFVSPAMAEELNLFAWSEYVPQTVLEGFQKETGIKVNYETYASNEEMLAKLLAGGGKYDLIQPSEYTIEALIADAKLEKLDHTKLPNLKNLDPAFAKMAHDPGNKYSCPWMSGTVGIVYNSEAVKTPIKGFKDVFNGSHAGKIVALDDGREIVSWVLGTQGRDINDMSDANLATVKPIMAGWLKQIKLFDSDSPKTALLAGDVDIGVVWSGEGAILLAKEPNKFKWVLPVEGTHRFIDSLAIPKGSTRVEAAHKFMNYILKPEVSKLISDEFPYTNPNVEARKLLDEAARTNAASYPPEGAKLGLFNDIGKRSSVIDELYTNLKSQ